MTTMQSKGVGSTPKTTSEALERRAFEADAEPLGFDLTRDSVAAPEPWAEYLDDATGHRWGGWLARAALQPPGDLEGGAHQPATAGADERKAFEDAMSGEPHYWHRMLFTDSDGVYREQTARMAWWAWQKRATLPVADSAKPAGQPLIEVVGFIKAVKNFTLAHRNPPACYEEDMDAIIAKVAAIAAAPAPASEQVEDVRTVNGQDV